MEKIIAIGLDLVQNAFQVHCYDGDGTVLLRKKLWCDQLFEFFSR